MNTRVLVPELMDDPSLARDEHQRALSGLARLNRWSGVARTTYAHIRKYAIESGNRPLRLLDIASGSGDLPIAWAKRAAREGLTIDITTTDISGFAVERQRQLAHSAGVSITAMEIDCVNNPLPTGYDLVTCCLFIHHLDEHQTFCLLQSMQAASENPILVCDLERSYLNMALVKIASKTLSRSNVVHTGDVYRTTTYPYIDVNNGGSYLGTIDALNLLLAVSDNGTKVIPGHGGISNTAEVTAFRDMLVDIRDKVAAAIREGMSLEEIQGAGLTAEYDERWAGSGRIGGSASMLAAVYADLAGD